MIKQTIKYLANPGYRLLQRHKLQHWCYRRNSLGFRIAARIIRNKIISSGNDINPSAKIADNVRFPHPIGIVIGAGAYIGPRVVICQNVTIGKQPWDDGYPHIESDVILYPNCVVVGPICLRRKSVISAGAIVTKSNIAKDGS